MGRSSVLDTMKMFHVLLLAPGLLAANIQQRTVEIQEHGTRYTQTVTFDFDRNVQKIHQPAHNNIVEANVIFDYNEGLFMESHPVDKRCYLKEIPPTMATMEQMFKVLSRRKAPIVSESTPVLAKTFGIVSELKLDEVVNQDMKEECKGHKVFMVAEIESEVAPRESFSPAQGNPLTGSLQGCSFHSQCFWQTCKFGSDSCFWTVNCPAGDASCNDMIHNSNFHVNGDPISCTACFNTHCKASDYDCDHDWHVNCNNGQGFEHAVKECSNDATIGNDCGATRCNIPSDEESWAGGKGGTFQCVQDTEHPAYVLEDHLCMFTCPSGNPGGYIQCKHSGKYEDHTMCV